MRIAGDFAARTTPQKIASKTAKESAPAPQDRVDTSFPSEASPWYGKLQSLRKMVPKEQNISLKITPEKVERNKHVTKMFHDLGMELDKMLNKRGPKSGANWGLWAAHASERAGVVLRGNTTVLGLQGPGRAHLNSANGVAMGDIGGPVSSFVEVFKDDEAPNPQKINSFLKGLPDDKLREVFDCYYQAMWEDDPQKKQELTLQGNIAYGGREQARLDPFLNKALSDLPGPDIIMVPLARMALAIAGVGPLEKFVTGHLVMKFPGYDGKLTDPVPESKNPENLQNSLVRNYDALTQDGLKGHLDVWRETGGVKGSHGDEMKGTEAEFWGDLPDRMHYISEMVREHHMDPNVYVDPTLNRKE
jgi:hypothetical protein